MNPFIAASGEARTIQALVITLGAVGGAIWLVTMVAFAVAARKGSDGPARDDPAVNRRAIRGLAVASVLTLVILAASLVTSFRAGASLAHPHQGEQLVITVTGHQWWWQVDYDAPLAYERLSTANEIRIPTGREVTMQLRSRDVIHSIWIPALHGKQDLIPGHRTSVRFTADTPGVYTGVCAEFCGLQHARMRLEVVAMPPAAYDAWYLQQLASSREPTDSAAARGRDVFLGSTCVMCHTVRGTQAGARLGPDLTHVGSRRMIAAGTLVNSEGNLAAWILDPQRFKHGTRMPGTPMQAADLSALVRYLRSLQ